MNPILLNRREAITRCTQLMGIALIGGPALLRGQAAAPRPPGEPDFTDDDLALMNEIGETIIPATTTPGAKAVQIGAFMAMMVNECYDAPQQAAFKAGLRQLDAVAGQRFGHGFRDGTPAERTTLLNELDREAQLLDAEKTKAAPVHYFTMLKQLTVVGYFTSETGGRAAFTYEEVPGRYEGNASYRPGDKVDYVMPSASLR